MQKYMNQTPSPRARVHMVFLKGTYLVESGDWASDVADIPVDIADLNISIRSQYHFLEGMKAFKENDRTKLDSILSVTQNDIKREKFVVEAGGGKLCSNVSRADASKTDISEANVRREQLMGLMAWLDQDTEKAEAHFKRSIQLFEGMSYSYGPPHIQKPVRELYADWLLSQGQEVEAKRQYQLSLEIGPKRLNPTRAIQSI